MNFVAAHAALTVAILFGVLALGAACFVAWPAWRLRGSAPLAHALLAGAIMLFVIGIGCGSYLLVGRPELAQRAMAAPNMSDVPGLVAALSRRIRERPDDLTGWTLLGRGYLSLGDPAQAAVAFQHAAQLAPPARRADLLSAYGEALTLSAGSVTPEAEAAFSAALARNPSDRAARFYLGQAYADRHDSGRALAMWQSLLADAPPNAPWRAELVNRMAMLQSRSGPAPDIGAMVAALAARLKTNPDDLDGWERLIRSYAVLGRNAEAKSAFAGAQTAMKGDPKALAALKDESQSLGIGK